MPSRSGKSGTAKTPQSLREIVQHHLLEDVFQSSKDAVQKNNRGKAGGSNWMVLVVDPESLRVISSSIGMYSLMEHQVSIVEHLMKKRAPFRDQAVLYLVEPNKRSLARIIDDWTPAKLKKGPLYGDSVYLYFLGRLPDDLFGMIKSCKELVKRVKVLKEVNLDFLTKEAYAYHFDMKVPSMYSDLYLSRGVGITPLQDRMISKLVTVCATLNEYPHVRFPAKNQLCVSLANLFQQKMNEFVGANSAWWYNGDGVHPNTERGTMLILDRKDDCLSPLIHEFTYEAMVHDLLPIDDDRITYDSVNAGTAKEGTEAGDTTKMDALLNDNDEVWVELRGKHIADVIQILSQKIRAIVDSSTGSALNKSAKGSGKALSINQMAKALKALPEYREIMSKLSQHMQIAHKCMDKFNKQGLLDLSDLEQTLATGKTDEDRSPKLKEMLGLVVEEFRKQSDSMIRLRLLAIVIVSQRGLGSESDLQKLIREANLSKNEAAVIENLKKMGCPMVQEVAAGKMGKIRDKRVTSYGREGTTSAIESEYSSSRYVCILQTILQDALSGDLSIDDYPSVMPLPDAESMLGSSSKKKVSSVRKDTGKTSKWKKTTTGSGAASGGKKKTHHGGRQIVFMSGGMCYSELRAARDVMDVTGTEIVVGSTRCIAPKDFINDVYTLSNLGKKNSDSDSESGEE